ncbi:hypothetical protein DYB32_009711 [Aphanomyces invadans]|uniref:DUF4419 domain-containing protein n=1 Tax=Aphanomyces invadans TaxID=157072 RepID=A0A3R7A2J7_9STRA|nr:hypothetical protein DYB32_009711 [Aphanomyces invadans]
MVTFAVAPVEANVIKVCSHDKNGNPVSLRKEYDEEGCTEILQSSPNLDGDAVLPSPNGFVLGVVRAYNEHHHLILRPDDVWLAIATQFGLFVNKNAEEVRHSLVKHQEGSKELVVFGGGTLRTANYGELASQMIDQMTDHLVDPSLSEWILPSFSTTTNHDRIVGSVVMMASMKKYFSYKFVLRCGVPSVTLLGTVADWEAIRNRVDKLTSFGPIATGWRDLLVPVLDQFVAAANNKPDVEFWQRICHYYPGGSGPSYLSGWITVFSVFGENGEWQGSERVVRGRHEEVRSDFPVIDTNDVAPGYLTVNVTIDDNGVEYKSLMFAGHLSFEKVQERSIQPSLSWAMVLKGKAESK